MILQERVVNLATTVIPAEYRGIRKLVTVMNSGRLWELGNIIGPIVNPTPLPIETVYNLVANGRLVYEHSQANPGRKVQLTKKNIFTNIVFPNAEGYVDPLVNANTYFVGVIDAVPEEDMDTDHLYVQIL